MTYKLDDKGREILSAIPVEGFVGDLKIDPLERVKMDIVRSFLRLYDKEQESNDDALDYDIDDNDDLDFGLTQYEHYASILENYDNKPKVVDASSSSGGHTVFVGSSEFNDDTSSDSNSSIEKNIQEK